MLHLPRLSLVTALAGQTAAVLVNGLKPKIPLGLICLPHKENDAWWYISPFSGSLIKASSPPPFGGGNLPAKLKEALACCDDPYKCNWYPEVTVTKAESALSRYECKLRWLGNHNFLFSFVYASWSACLYKDTKEAFAAISNLPSFQSRRADQCFLRSLLAAKTSRSFAKSGVLFIGAELSSGEMHAWILECGSQPDHEDRAWVNYRPLLAWVR